MQVVLSSVTFLSFSALLELYASPVTRYQMLRNLFPCFNGVFFGVHLYQPTTYFRDDPYPMCLILQSTVSSRSSAVGLLE